MNENIENTAAEPSLSEVLQIRRDKLSALVAAGRDPFEKVRFDFDAYRTISTRWRAGPSASPEE